MNRKARRDNLDQRIKASWELHDDDDCSTERLLAMVCDDCGCDVSRVIDGLKRTGVLEAAHEQQESGK